MRAEHCEDCTVEDNDINNQDETRGPDTAIQLRYSHRAVINNNTVKAYYNGIYADNNEDYTLINIKLFKTTDFRFS